jgi:hypothetical protein
MEDEERLTGVACHKPLYDADTLMDEQLRMDGCIYGDNYKSVCCPGRNKCYKCGWNPRVAEVRKRQIRRKLGR